MDRIHVTFRRLNTWAKREFDTLFFLLYTLAIGGHYRQVTLYYYYYSYSIAESSLSNDIKTVDNLLLSALFLSIERLVRKP